MLQEPEEITLPDNIYNQKKNHPTGTKKKILIADDDQGILKVMSMMLRLEGYQVDATAFGSTVLDLKNNDLPDIILLDLWMAGIDGCDICRSLKEDPKCRHIPVVLISAGKGLRQAAADCNADDYLAKPFEKEELVALIEKFLT